jgi:hypothetical protein
MNITVSRLNTTYTSVNGVLFDKNGRTLIQYPQGKRGEYTVPSTVTTIADGAFSDCTKLTSVIISTMVTRIGNDAFFDCTNLMSVNIESSRFLIGEREFSIGARAFLDCKSLKNITIPSSVTSIDDNAFRGCDNLRTVVLSRRTRIGSGTFPATTQIIYSDEK